MDVRESDTDPRPAACPVPVVVTQIVPVEVAGPNRVQRYTDQQRPPATCLEKGVGEAAGVAVLLD